MDVGGGFSQVLRQMHTAFPDNFRQLMQMRFEPLNRLGYINHWVPYIYLYSSRTSLLAMQQNDHYNKTGSAVFHTIFKFSYSDYLP
jgi:hypothetical protein